MSALYGLYYLCVDFMVALANFGSITYRDANILIVFGLIPAVLIMDFMITAGLLARAAMRRRRSWLAGRRG
jgi:hypothetical protein